MSAEGPRGHDREYDFGPAEDLTRTREFNFEDDGLPPRPRTLREGPRPPRRPAWLRIGIAVVAVAAVVLIAAGAVRAMYSGKALPGTKVGGESVGGKTEDEVRAVVRKLADPERRVVLSAPGRGPLRVSAAGGGLETNVAATVAQVMDHRRGNFLSPLLSVAYGGNVRLVATVDDTQLASSVKRLADAVDEEPYAGALTIDPQTLNVSTKPSESGRVVDQEKLIERLRKALLRPNGKTVEIPVDTARAVSDDKVADVKADAEQYLRQPLRLTGAGTVYTVKPAFLADLLALEAVDGGRDARLGINTAVLSKLSNRVADARDRSAKSATISAPQRGPVVDGKADVSWSPKSAKVTVGSEGRTGLAVKIPELNTNIRAAVRKGEHQATVPTTKTQAPVSKATAAKIDRVIGTFTTYYIAGQPRVTNIQRIARSIDRTIIAPGQTFSLNELAGERTLAKGYVEAPFIAGNKIEPSVGGGVSQFSTTMYNAAYFAGLQIDAHQPHSLFIDRYPAGRESTLNWPDIDMRWTNDTDTPILIRTLADNAGVTVTLYGDNGGRKVDAVPGAREPNPGGNFKITITRVITYGDGREVKQPVTTSYANEVTDGGPPQE